MHLSIDFLFLTTHDCIGLVQYTCICRQLSCIDPITQYKASIFCLIIQG